jgi:hypothetical protein
VVPDNYGPVLFLDLKEMRYKPEVQQALTAQMAPALAAIPSEAANVIEGAVLARDGDDGGAIVVLSTPLDIATMLSVASSLEISSKTAEPETFREHQIWSIEEFGSRLAIGSVDKSTSVAVAGSSPPDVSHLQRVKGALDTFDGLTPALLGSDALSSVANNLPQGVVVALFDGCSALDSISAVAGLEDCNAAGVSAELIDQDTISINVIAGFQEDGKAEAALRSLKAAGILLGEAVPQDWAARQEGSLVRVRLIVEFDQIASAFDAFGLTPGGPTPTPTAVPALVEVAILLTYAQDLSQGNRRVLLRWRARSADLGVENAYEIYRRS